MTQAAQGQDDNAGDDENLSPGWDAITAALERLYPGQEPKHYATVLKWMFGGPDPLDGVSVWKRMEPVPHWHYLSYGLSELYAKESGDADTSGYGFELTFRLACEARRGRTARMGHQLPAEPRALRVQERQRIRRRPLDDRQRPHRAGAGDADLLDGLRVRP